MQCKHLLTVVVFIGTMAKVFSLEMAKDRRAGGIQPANVDDKDIQQAAVFATAKLDKTRNSPFALKVVHVVKATKQVVSGMNYDITTIVGETNCRKDQEKDLSECPLRSGEKNLLECHFVVWSQPWMEVQMKVTDSECVPARQSQAMDYHHQFDDFIHRYGRQYGNTTTEYEYRYSVFVKNMQKVDLLNKHEQSTAVYGATKFADMTEEEFRWYLSGPMKPSGITKHATIPKGQPPQEFDWRTKGAVTGVKNQGACGSCWAFSVTGNIEGQWKIKKGELISLSEQQLVDCDKVDHGCNGGEMSDAYNAIIKMGGCESEATYPYHGRNEQCKFQVSNVKVYINGSVNISKNEDEMASWLAANGPISIGINAAVMQFYFGGISHPWKIFCAPANLDHGVLIVGYGVKDKEPFWIVKNSWGADWGVNGYYLVYRGDGVCGLNLDCTSAVVD